MNKFKGNNFWSQCFEFSFDNDKVYVFLIPENCIFFSFRIDSIKRRYKSGLFSSLNFCVMQYLIYFSTRISSLPKQPHHRHFIFLICTEADVHCKRQRCAVFMNEFRWFHITELSNQIHIFTLVCFFWR